MLLKRLFGSTPAARPAVRRVVLLEEGAGSPSSDYLLLPWLRRLGVAVVRGDVRRSPGQGDLAEGDLVVISRYVPPLWRRPLQKRHDVLASVVYFMDDDLFDLRAHRGLAATYAKKLATFATSQRKWLELNADAFWVSTAALAGKYSGLNPEIIPLDPGPELREPTVEGVRIVYHGTASHAEEIEWLHAVVAGVQARCDHTHVELFGEHPVHKRYRDLPRVAVLHPMRWENYKAYTASHRAAIGLAPLLPGEFNAARGPVKFYDYARMGAAGIYTDAPPYRGFIDDRVDGLLLPNDPQRWVDTLVALASSPELARLQAGMRDRISRQASPGGTAPPPPCA